MVELDNLARYCLVIGFVLTAVTTGILFYTSHWTNICIVDSLEKQIIDKTELVRCITNPSDIEGPLLIGNILGVSAMTYSSAIALRKKHKPQSHDKIDNSVQEKKGKEVKTTDKQAMIKDYIFIITIVTAVIVNLYFIINFLFPPAEPVVVNKIDLGNFTIRYTGWDYDDNKTAIMRETDRYFVQITVENKFPSNVTLYYSDTIAQTNPSMLPQPPPMTITKGSIQNIPRIFYLHGGMNVLDASFDFYTTLNPNSGKMWPSPAEIGKPTSFNLVTKRALTESEYEGRFVLVATIVLAEATISLVVVNHLNVRETRNFLNETRESNKLSRQSNEESKKSNELMLKSNEILEKEFLSKMRPILQFSKSKAELSGPQDKLIVTLRITLTNSGSVPARKINVYHSETTKEDIEDLVKEKEAIRKHGQFIGTIQNGSSQSFVITIPWEKSKQTTKFVMLFEYYRFDKKEEELALCQVTGGAEPIPHQWYINEDIIEAENKNKEMSSGKAMPK